MTEAEWIVSDWPDDLLEHVCSLRRTALGLTGSFPEQNTTFRPRVYPRKRRLFLAACCRRIWGLLPTAARAAIDVAEQFADGKACDADRIAAVAQVESAGNAYFRQGSETDPVWRGGWDALKAAGGAVLPFTDVDYSRISLWVGPGDRPFLDEDHYDGGFGFTACYAVNALVVAEDDPAIAPLLGVRWRFLYPRFVAEEGLPVVGTRWYSELVAQCNLLRDIFGNPFRPPPAIDPAWLRWHDGTIPRLAQQMYDARDFAAMPILADALEEAGCTSADILEHCRGPGPHVRGCFVVDLVLGKE